MRFSSARISAPFSFGVTYERSGRVMDRLIHIRHHNARLFCPTDTELLGRLAPWPLPPLHQSRANPVNTYPITTEPMKLIRLALQNHTIALWRIVFAHEIL